MIGQPMIGRDIRVRGLVQGVGYRPTVWRLARDHGLVGTVANDGAGVVIAAFGPEAALDAFVAALRTQAPPLARVASVIAQPLDVSGAPTDFTIVASHDGTVETGIVPDAATCPACAAEIFDTANRRAGYAFTNCTHCGPRLSIVRAIPYDRATTAMAPFTMCPACQAEYDDPADRRFHAQPNACAVCGPRVWLEPSATVAGDRAVLAEAARLITSGAILAIKGIGGFHLACDATNGAAVAQLRARKRRHHKPFALMAGDIAMVARYAHLDHASRAALESPAAPIVILPARADATPAIAADVAPMPDGAARTLGIMLPYAPLHHLLMAELDRPIVLTSGNLSDEPQCTDNAEARARLAGLADGFVMGDRAIINRLDDSVVRVMAGQPRVIRRARGLAPAPFALPSGFGDAPPILALGAEQKSAIALARSDQIILSQHLGDLDEPATHADFRATIDLYSELYRFAPAAIAIDRHPDYHASQWGRARAAADGLALIAVQHHHAHIAATLIEHGWPRDRGPVLGVCLDGLGYGLNGGLWGGEFLLCDYRRLSRLGHIAEIAMPGGARAAREPWRNLFAHLEAWIGWPAFARQYKGLACTEHLASKPVATLSAMIAKAINAPRASSAGRLCDAVAAACGLYAEATSFEGQAAIALEAAAAPAIADSTTGYRGAVADGVIGWAPLWQALFDDLRARVPIAIIAARFHVGFAETLADCAADLAGRSGLSTIALGGGVFQNALLIEGVIARLMAAGFDVLAPAEVPANDGGIALGQAAIAAAQLSQ